MKTIFPNPSASAILSVGYYTASPVETCNRCGQGIKYVASVKLADGTFYKYGLDCINKVLAGDNSVKRLFKKNAELLELWTTSLEIVSRPLDQIKTGQEYYGTGAFFMNHDNGQKLACNGGYLFHPVMQEGKIENTPYAQSFRQKGGYAGHEREALANIEKAKEFYRKEIARLSGWLAAVIKRGILAGEK